MHVILAARSQDRLEELAEIIRRDGGDAEIYIADLTDEDARTRLFEFIRKSRINIDVLVNNAGFGWYGYFSEMDWQTKSEMININVIATVHLTHLFLPQMLARKSGHIINVSSIVGGIPAQGVAMYSASKAFVDAFSTSLHRELKGTGVHMSTIRPGPVKTAFFDTASNSPNGLQVPTEQFAIPVERVAESILRLLNHPRRVAYLPWWLRAVPWLEMLFGWAQDIVGPVALRRSSKKMRVVS